MSVNQWGGDHVRLRGVRPDDWEQFLRWDTDTDANRHGWMIHPPRGEESARKFAKDASAAEPDGDNYRYVIETLEGLPVGTLNTHGCDRVNRRFEYGISLDRQYWGKGYAEDALRVILRFMFEERGYHKVNAWVYAFNERSQRMHEKFGMVHEGTARQTHFTNGEFHDERLYGMTSREFGERYPRTV